VRDPPVHRDEADDAEQNAGEGREYRGAPRLRLAPPRPADPRAERQPRIEPLAGDALAIEEIQRRRFAQRAPQRERQQGGLQQPQRKQPVHGTAPRPTRVCGVACRERLQRPGQRDEQQGGH
jgi:hypothetical protein